MKQTFRRNNHSEDSIQKLVIQNQDQNDRTNEVHTNQDITYQIQRMFKNKDKSHINPT